MFFCLYKDSGVSDISSLCKPVKKIIMSTNKWFYVPGLHFHDIYTNEVSAWAMANVFKSPSSRTCISVNPLENNNKVLHFKLHQVRGHWLQVHAGRVYSLLSKNKRSSRVKSQTFLVQIPVLYFEQYNQWTYYFLNVRFSFVKSISFW